MAFNFSFNSNKYDYWEIYETIKKYYPIGINRKEGRGIYFKYKGLMPLEKLVVDNLQIQDNYHERWTSFENQLGEALNKEIVGTTYGQAPSFSSSVILSKNTFEDCVHKKELHFAVSLVGDYYQIYGLDIISIKNKAYSVINAVTISPHEEYKEAFELVEQYIQDRYKNYKIIPFFIGQTIINGLEVRYSDDLNCSVNKALFNDFVSEEKIPGLLQGDQSYGCNQWLK